MTNEDVRWEQRFSNYKKALEKLSQAVRHINATYTDEDGKIGMDEGSFNFNFDIIKEGLIQRFEYTFELAWNVMKDYAVFQGVQISGGPRDAIREGVQLELIQNGKLWMEMIRSRNKTSHTYNVETANEIFADAIHSYYPAFKEFRETMEGRIGSQNMD